MAAEDCIQNIGNAIQHEDPGEEQMPMPRHRKPLSAGNRSPRWKRTLLDFLVVEHPRSAEHAGSVELAPEDLGYPMQLSIPVFPGCEGQQRRAEMRALSPIQVWMRIEYRESAHQQQEET